MSGDRAADGPKLGDLPDPIREWLTELAAEEEVSEQELLSRLIDDRQGPDTGAIEDRLDAVEAAVSALEDDLDEKIADVRERVIQVKRETDAKAPAEHEHPDIVERIDEAVAAAESVEDLVSDLDDRVTSGFENYEVVLDYLVETVADIERKLDVLAESALGLREEVTGLRRAHAHRRAVAALRASANAHGTRSAECGACGDRVDLGLLSTPECPHCGESFRSFSPKDGLFDSAVLETGSHPQLEPADEDDATAPLEEIAGRERSDGPPSGSGPDTPATSDRTREGAGTATDTAGDGPDEPADSTGPFDGWISADDHPEPPPSTGDDPDGDASDEPEDPPEDLHTLFGKDRKD